MKRVLLLIGGVMQVLIAALHVYMFFGMARANEIPAGLKPLLHIFNAAVLTAVVFFAYVSFFRRRELVETGFGRLVGWFIAVFYLQRALAEVLVSGFHPVNFGVLMAIAALYSLVALPSRPHGSRVGDRPQGAMEATAGRAA